MNLAIESTGLACAVGRSAPLACAAIRAGLSRRTALPAQTTLAADSEAEPAFGHPIPIVTGGYALFARWRRLARAALLDLRRRLAPRADEADAWERTLFVFVLPEPAERSLFDEPRSDDDWRATWVEPLLRSVGLEVPGARIAMHVGTAPAVAVARTPGWLVDRRCDRAVVVAADSCVEEGATRLLAQADRLWSPDRPVGLSPGEAGVAVLLADARAASGPAIAGLATATAPVADDTERGLAGHRLADCIREAFGPTAPGPTIQWITDLNGEPWRANQLGHAQVRLTANGLRLPGFEAPASSTGDTGAAQFYLGLALAHHLHERARRREFLVTCAGHGGELAACVVRAGDASRK